MFGLWFGAENIDVCVNILSGGREVFKFVREKGVICLQFNIGVIYILQLYTSIYIILYSIIYLKNIHYNKNIQLNEHKKEISFAIIQVSVLSGQKEMIRKHDRRKNYEEKKWKKC